MCLLCHRGLNDGQAKLNVISRLVSSIAVECLANVRYIFRFSYTAVKTVIWKSKRSSLSFRQLYPKSHFKLMRTSVLYIIGFVRFHLFAAVLIAVTLAASACSAASVYKFFHVLARDGHGNRWHIIQCLKCFLCVKK